MWPYILVGKSELERASFPLAKQLLGLDALSFDDSAGFYTVIDTFSRNVTLVGAKLELCIQAGIRDLYHAGITVMVDPALVVSKIEIRDDAEISVEKKFALLKKCFNMNQYEERDGVLVFRP